MGFDTSRGLIDLVFWWFFLALPVTSHIESPFDVHSKSCQIVLHLLWVFCGKSTRRLHPSSKSLMCISPTSSSPAPSSSSTASWSELSLSTPSFQDLSHALLPSFSPVRPKTSFFSVSIVAVLQFFPGTEKNVLFLSYRLIHIAKAISFFLSVTNYGFNARYVTSDFFFCAALDTIFGRSSRWSLTAHAILFCYNHVAGIAFLRLKYNFMAAGPFSPRKIVSLSSFASFPHQISNFVLLLYSFVENASGSLRNLQGREPRARLCGLAPR
jgi:hypothetical protein